MFGGIGGIGGIDERGADKKGLAGFVLNAKGAVKLLGEGMATPRGGASRINPTSRTHRDLVSQTQRTKRHRFVGSRAQRAAENLNASKRILLWGCSNLWLAAARA